MTEIQNEATVLSEDYVRFLIHLAGRKVIEPMVFHASLLDETTTSAVAGEGEVRSCADPHGRPRQPSAQLSPKFSTTPEVN